MPLNLSGWTSRIGNGVFTESANFASSVFLGRPTHAANIHALPDGRVARDSDGAWRKRSKRKKPRVVHLKGVPVKPADPVSQMAQLRPILGVWLLATHPVNACTVGSAVAPKPSRAAVAIRGRIR